MTYYIYTLSDPRNNQVKYIGYSKNPKERYFNHLCTTKLKTKKNSWIKSLKRKDLNPILDLLDECSSIEEVHDLEVYWISQFKTWGFDLVNGTLGGEGREAPVKNETKIKISKTLKDKYSKEPHKLKGKEWTQSHKDLWSNLRKGKIPVCSFKGHSHPNKKKIECYKNGILLKEFDSILQASKELNINPGSISNNCKKKSKTAKGYEFKYKDAA